MNIIENLVIIGHSPIVGEVTSVVTAKKEKNPGLFLAPQGALVGLDF